MSSVKICFSDLSVELAGNEPNQELAERALNLLSFLVQERLRYDECSPVEEEETNVIFPANNNISTVLPPDVLKAYL